MSELTLPKDFFFGAAMSGPQTEGGWNVGGKLENLWDTWSMEDISSFYNQVGSYVGNDFMHHYKDDLALLKSLGMDNYRTSIQWSRLLDQDGNINPEGAAWYHELFAASKEAGLEVFVNLYHFDLPTYLYRRGGWLNREVCEAYANYAYKAFCEFGKEVRCWFTFNEPIVEPENRYWHPIWYPQLVDAGHLDEERGRDQADDDGREHAVGAGVAGDEGAGDRGGGDLLGDERRGGGERGRHGLRHHDEEHGEGNDNAGDGVVKALVGGQAVGDHAAQQDRGDRERALRQRGAPVLGRRQDVGVGEDARARGVDAPQEREEDVIEQCRKTGEDEDRHDGGEAVAQRAEVHLVADPCGNLRELVKEALTVGHCFHSLPLEQCLLQTLPLPEERVPCNKIGRAPPGGARDTLARRTEAGFTVLLARARRRTYLTTCDVATSVSQAADFLGLRS